MTTNFTGDAEIWYLVADAADPDGTREVIAEVDHQSGTLVIDRKSFKTPPLNLNQTSVKVSLETDGGGSLQPNDEVTLKLSLLFEAGIFKGNLRVTLSNKADHVAQKPQMGGGTRPVTLKVAPYDASNGGFAVAGEARLSGLLPHDRVAIRLQGRFTPAIPV